MHENERMNQLECDPVVNGQRTEADVDGTWKGDAFCVGWWGRQRRLSVGIGEANELIRPLRFGAVIRILEAIEANMFFPRKMCCFP